jgi:hypothetical protein
MPHLNVHENNPAWRYFETVKRVDVSLYSDLDALGIRWIMRGPIWPNLGKWVSVREKKNKQKKSKQITMSATMDGRSMTLSSTSTSMCANSAPGYTETAHEALMLSGLDREREYGEARSSSSSRTYLPKSKCDFAPRPSAPLISRPVALYTRQATCLMGGKPVSSWEDESNAFIHATSRRCRRTCVVLVPRLPLQITLYKK